jgi:translation elongation factor EF-1alpha
MNGQFKILTTLKIKDRGLALIGRIVKGHIKKGNKLIFYTEELKIEKEIIALEFVDHIAKKESYIGLFFGHKNEIEKEAFSELIIKEQIAEVRK